MSLTQRVNSGANVETAQEILDNLNANSTAGAVNAAIDLGGRKQHGESGHFGSHSSLSQGST